MGKSRGGTYVGVDVGGTNIQAGVIDTKAKVLGRAKLKTKAQSGPSGVIVRIVEAIDEALQDAGLTLKDVTAIGVGAPGPVDIRKGVVLRAVNLRWPAVALAEKLRDRLHRPVTIDNDANISAWGEHVAGAGRGHPDLLAVWVGTGIGAGIVLNGQLYHGHFLTAGEIGHTILSADAPLGRRTLENLASRTAVVNQFVLLMQANHPSKIADLVKGELGNIRSRVLAQALREGDALAQQVIQRAALYVGAAIASSVTLLSLPCVVVGGGLTDSLGKTWMNCIRKAFDEFVFPPELRKCEVVASQLGEDAGIIGSGLLAMQRLGGN